MTRQWSKLSLEEAGVVLLDCDHRTPPAAETGLPYVAIPQIRNGRLDLSTARLISREHFEDWTRKTKPVADDVIVVRRCNSGDSAWVPPGAEIALGQNLVVLRATGPRVVPGFLRWLLRGPEWWEQVRKFINVGAVFDSLRCRDIPKFVVTIPPVEAQRSITHVLGALDDKIELNRGTTETLEAMVRAIFRSWFLDPDSPDDGGIPRGWSRTTLRDHVTLQRGTTYSGRLVGLPGPALLGLGSIEPGGGFRNGHYKTYGGECPEKLMLFAGDLFVALKGATKDGSMVGSIARVPPSVPSGRLTQDTVKLQFLKPGSGIDRYIYWLLRMPHYRAYCAGRITGSAQVGLSRDDFLSYPVPLPPENTLAAFGDIEASLSRCMDTADAESETLAAVRDTLLPQLLSGKLRVPEAERAVEAAL